MMSLDKQLRLLHTDGYLDSENTIRDLTSGKAEFEYMEQFVKNTKTFFDFEVCCEQLRSLWTGYCLHHNLDCDTGTYDSDLQRLWEVVERARGGSGPWRDFNRFDEYMCKYLV